MTLREVLHAHIPTLRPDSTVRDAVDKMDVYQFPCLVIVDLDRKPIAVITEGDLGRAVSQQGNLVQLANQPALVYASKDPVTVGCDLEIGEALHLMLNSGLTVLPVVDEGNLAGVVLRMDLMQAMLLDVSGPKSP